MIPLRLKTSGLPLEEPLVVRLQVNRNDHAQEVSQHDAFLVSKNDQSAEFDFQGFSFALEVGNPNDVDGDVIMLLPEGRSVHRLIRAKSKHNTLLITEQCDQLCVMCSQPPKNYHVDLFEHFATAIKLAPRNATIGLSGGEPLLYKTELFNMMSISLQERTDVMFIF